MPSTANESRSTKRIGRPPTGDPARPIASVCGSSATREWVEWLFQVHGTTKSEAILEGLQLLAKKHRYERELPEV